MNHGALTNGSEVKAPPLIDGISHVVWKHVQVRHAHVY